MLFYINQSNFERIYSIQYYLKEIEIIRVKEREFIFLERPFFQMLINYGVLEFVLFTLLLMSIHI